jgi:fatty-acyl-CoA synthase
VSVATLATPEVVRDHPTSVGKPALGSRIAILDDAGRRVPTGERGRIFVGTVTPFEGYTGGGGKEIIDGMLATGDVGHFDRAGLLYVDGRDDDMIVSGGENVFPAEVEELLVAHSAVHEVAVVGVEDDEFGSASARSSCCCPAHSSDRRGPHPRAREPGPLQGAARRDLPRRAPRNPTGKVLKRELVTWDQDATP